MAQLQFIKRIGYSDISTLADDNSAFFYEAGMAIDADGGYHAYNQNGSGLDYLGNAGKPGNWWALVTDNGRPSGNPLIQKASDPAPGFYIATTSLEDTSLPESDPRRYVNAEAINFIVLPGKLNLGSAVAAPSLGDFGVVIRPDTGGWDYVVYADVGPAGQIGEASIAAAQALGIPSSPKNGGTAHGIVYIIFPGSQQGWPLSQADIDQNAAGLFAEWGGIDKAKDCFPNLPWSS